MPECKSNNSVYEVLDEEKGGNENENEKDLERCVGVFDC